MPLKINTFSNQSGGNAFYKAVTHPLAADKARQLIGHLQKSGPIAIYDPNNQLESFAEFFPLTGVDISDYFVQDIERIGHEFMGKKAQPITAIQNGSYRTLFVACFDAQKPTDQIRHMLPAQVPLLNLDTLRLPREMQTNQQNYLANINFATNLAFFRDKDGHHTRTVTANYWSTYGAKDPRAFCYLMDEQGQKLAEWTDPLPAANATIAFDSAEIRKRFKLPDFTGQLFIHILSAAGHDIVKYALDTYGDDKSVLSCTHDANAWPSDQFAGLPAPTEEEEVVLWVQNSHPAPIPAKSIGLNLMGSDAIQWLNKEIPAFGTHRLTVAELLPAARWPQQIEIQAGKHFVRPRYEIFSKNGHIRIAHPNVERNDLKPDTKLPTLGALFGKGHILPAPILPLDRYMNWVLPTPMSTGLKTLPVKALIYNTRGEQIAEHKFGNLKRSDSTALNINDLLKDKPLDTGYGHVELVYDFEAGQETDGWLHALFRFEDKRSGHAAETSFGSHIFNTTITYKNEPQSYAGKAPGLSTRLFLRMGAPTYDTMCHLVYPVSTTWHAASDTALILTSNMGQEIAKRNVRIPRGGSLLWRTSNMFKEEDIKAAGPNAYTLIRDTTCRLFGYHGLVSGDQAFSLDHMFGF
jgi:hypothetical protein